jgi:glycosyltransferase involved in cell wall biosynthesis
MYVGRLAAEKNLKLLFAAFKRLAVEHADIRLLIVGGGPGEHECRRMAADTGYSSRIAFAGMVSRGDVAGYYSAGDIFTFPSTTETQGLVLCEALGAGLPCVAVKAGGSPEMLLDEVDSLLSRDDVDDFASKIDLLLANPSMMQQFSENAVKSAARFSPGSMARCMLHAYESVRSGDRRSSPNS